MGNGLSCRETYWSHWLTVRIRVQTSRLRFGVQQYAMTTLSFDHQEIASHENIRDYYGKVLGSTEDLATSACCSTETLPERHKEILNEIAPEILEKFYGCGAPLPPALEGCTVLDLGCGTGRDVYLASRLVGPEGHVIGVDMTPEQLDVAERYIDEQTRRFGFAKPNVSFHRGLIEDLKGSGIKDNSVDVVISNCVINLSPRKDLVFSEIFRVLKPGGELYFSDVFADRRLPASCQEDSVLHGECIGGALYLEDFRRLLASLGCPDHREMSCRPVEILNPEIQDKVGNARFYSVTIRAFKSPSLEDRCEDYGQVAYYEGGIPGHPHAFALDDHHRFELGKPMLVCGNTAAMVSETRFAKYFRMVGDRTTHYGLFDCSAGEGGGAETEANGSACC